MHTILKTAEISTEVIKLIQGAKDYCYLVTPYFKPWPLLDRVLEGTRDRGPQVTIICRHDDQRQTKLEELARWQARFGCELILLNYLHIKLYVSDQAAILGSMNLYDSSQVKNFELAYLISNRRDARDFLRNVIEADLLAAKPVTVFKGWFSENESTKASQLAQQMAQLDKRGFCVVCGDKCDLDRSKSPTIIRCPECWRRNQATTNWDLQTTFCHYCGERHRSTGTAALHDTCKRELASILDSRYYKRP